MIFCYFTDLDQGAPWTAALHAAPMSHGSGLYGLAYVTQAACHVLPESGSFDPAEIFEIIEHWPGLVFFAAPTMIKRLALAAACAATARAFTHPFVAVRPSVAAPSVSMADEGVDTATLTLMATPTPPPALGSRTTDPSASKPTVQLRCSGKWPSPPSGIR